MKNLGAGGGSTGAQAGVITVKNGASATTVTCSPGTGTTSHDTTHTAAFSVGQALQVTVTTGHATDTTADVRVSLQCDYGFTAILPV